MRFALFLATVLMWCVQVVHATPVWQTESYDVRNYDQKLNQLLKQAHQKHLNDLNARIVFFSQAFLGKPYELGALGEGYKGQYDQKPFYRTDKFDCLTYVSTVLALAESHGTNQFKKNLANIQYKNGNIGYLNRNHFTSLDWNINNIEAGRLVDITRSFKNQSGWPVFKTAKALINKRAWYQKKSLATLNQLKSVDKVHAQNMLTELKEKSRSLKNVYASIDYIPLKALFNKKGKPNLYLFSQIPNGAIIEIVRPNWAVEKQIGTRLHVSHLGFVIHADKGVMFREASSVENKVIDIPLIDYLRPYLKSPTIKGITILQTAR